MTRPRTFVNKKFTTVQFCGTPGTFLFIPPGVPHNIANACDKPARVLMTVSPPGHENYFEELAKAVSGDSPTDAKAIGALRRRYDTDQLSALKN